MKKLLLLAVISVFAAGSAFAQNYFGYESKNDFRKSSSLFVDYRGEVQVGYSVGVGSIGANRVNIHTIHGVQIGDYFSAGLGTGIDLYHGESDTAFLIPVFINFKGFLPVSALVSPYASCDIGGGFGVGDISGLSGFMCTPAVGVQVGIFQVQVGYALQQFSEEGIGLSCNAVQFKLGVNF